jgi:hypothetical protein
MTIASATTIHDSNLEAIALILGGEVITAKPGALVLGPQYAEGQVAVIQRTIEGFASENLARFERFESAWRVIEMNEEAAMVIEKIVEEKDHPCLQGAVEAIHKCFWTNSGINIKDVYKNAKEFGVRQEWLDAFVLAKLNNQVCNGGFSQWVGNGYSVLYQETRIALNNVGTNNAKKIWKMLGSLEQYFDKSWSFKEEKEDDYEGDCLECCGSGKVFEDELCDDCCGSGLAYEIGSIYSPGDDQAERINPDFYAINKDFLKEVELYVSGNPLSKASQDEETMANTTCRYPNVKVKLIDKDGNAMEIISSVTLALRRAGVSKEFINTYVKEAMSGDYGHVIATTAEWVVVE